MRPGLVARIGVGAAAGAFSPETSVASGTLKGWWDASTLSDADGTALASQPNSVADGLWPLVQATSGARPVVKTNIQNGLRVVRGDGTQWMATAAITNRITGTGLTLFDVGIRRAYVSGAGLLALAKAADGADYLSPTGAFIGYQSVSNTQANYQAGNPAAFLGHPGDGVPQILTTWWDGTDNRMECRAGGTTQTATPFANAPTFNIELVQILKRIGFAQTGQHDSCERLVYQGSLNSTDRAAVLAYLQAKWGIA